MKFLRNFWWPCADLLRDWNTHLRSEFVDGKEKKRDWQGNWIYPGDSVTIVTPDANRRIIEEARKMSILGTKQFDSLTIRKLRINEEKPPLIDTWKMWRDYKAKGKL